jgi:hypothetical protein
MTAKIGFTDEEQIKVNEASLYYLKEQIERIESGIVKVVDCGMEVKSKEVTNFEVDSYRVFEPTKGITIHVSTVEI